MLEALQVPANVAAAGKLRHELAKAFGFCSEHSSLPGSWENSNWCGIGLREQLLQFIRVGSLY
eukprot:5662314-Amphidinium_carterae.1